MIIVLWNCDLLACNHIIYTYIMFYESTSILGEIYNAGNNWRSKEEKEAPYAVDGRHQKCNWTLDKGLKSVGERQEKVEIISEQHSQEEETDQCLNQGEGTARITRSLQTRRTSSSSTLCNYY